MRLRHRVLLALPITVTAVLLATGVAHAKVAPSSATIDGDGLAAPIDIDAEGGLPGGSPDGFFRLVEQAGFFPASMGLVPDPMLDEAPTHVLGPALIITWHVDEHGLGSGVLRQIVYPHADGGPLTFTEPGQEYFDGMTAQGGWYRAPAGIVGSLEAVGVPVDDLVGATATASAASGSDRPSGSNWVPVVFAALFLTGASVLIVNRRRERERLRLRAT